MKQASKRLMAATVVLGGVVLGTATASAWQDTATPSAATEANDVTVSPLLEPDVDIFWAQEAALASYPEAAVLWITLDGQTDSLVYTVGLSSGAEVEVDGTTGEIVADRLSEGAVETPAFVLAEGHRLLGRADVSIDEAVAAALTAVPHAGDPVRIELEIDDARLQYEIRFNRYEVTVDARSGQVTEVDRKLGLFRR